MRQTNASLWVAFLLVAIATSSSCANRDASSSAGAADQHVAMIRDYIDALNRGDASYLDEYLGPGYVYHGADGDLDEQDFRALHQSMLTAFAGGTMTADAIIPAGDKVTTRWTFHGTQSGDFQGVPATGRDVTVSGIIVSRFQDGKVVEEWEQIDRLGMMRQLGALPAPPEPTR